MEYTQISKTKFNQDYNIVKILYRKAEIMEFAKNYKENDGVVAFAIRKQHKLTLEDVMAEIRNIRTEVRTNKTTLEDVMAEIRDIRTEVRTNKATLENVIVEIKAINTRLGKIETRLDKHDELFRQHGWMK